MAAPIATSVSLANAECWLRRTPPAIIARLDKVINETLRDPAVHGKFDGLDFDIIGGTLQRLAGFNKCEFEREREVEQTGERAQYSRGLVWSIARENHRHRNHPPSRPA